MSVLVDRAIEAAGLGDVLAARQAGRLSEQHVARLRAADLLALGAAADRARREESGDAVRIWTVDDDAAGEGSAVVLPREDEELSGLELLREVAIARLTAPAGTHVRVDWTRCGLELAQVALGFGADELAGRISTKRGLPIAEGDMAGTGKKSQRVSMQLAKQRELTEYVRRAGREPVLVGVGGAILPTATATATATASATATATATPTATATAPPTPTAPATPTPTAPPTPHYAEDA